jgi:putative ABC transport system permease protein
MLGCGAGWVIGSLLGRYNTQMYADLFRFPILLYRPSASAFAIAAAVTTVATLVGALTAVHRAVALPPAEAMRPPAPAVYRHGLLTRLGVMLWLDQPTRIALRQIGRWPMRAALTCVGISLSVGLLIMALQWGDSVENIAQVYFYDAQHQSMTVGFSEPMPTSVVEEFKHFPGVMMVEPLRIVPADFSVGTYRHRGSLAGLEQGSTLQPIHDDSTGKNIPVPPDGLVLGSRLASKLGVNVGDSVWVEVLEGRRPEGAVPVSAIFDTTIAMPAYMSLDALNRWLKVRPSLQYVNLKVDENAEAALFPVLKSTPKVTAVMLKRAAIDAFYATLVEHLMTFISIFTGFAAALGFGVAYNSTRIALSERGRELATLRVLGFTRGEISYILLGEVALLIIVALPLGCLVGRWLSLIMARAFDTELFRIPFVINASTYGTSVVFAIIATTASAALVRRRVQHLDLIRVLKTRE